MCHWDVAYTQLLTNLWVTETETPHWDWGGMSNERKPSVWVGCYTIFSTEPWPLTTAGPGQPGLGAGGPPQGSHCSCVTGGRLRDAPTAAPSVASPGQSTATNEDQGTVQPCEGTRQNAVEAPGPVAWGSLQGWAGPRASPVPGSSTSELQLTSNGLLTTLTNTSSCGPQVTTQRSGLRVPRTAGEELPVSTGLLPRIRSAVSGSRPSLLLAPTTLRLNPLGSKCLWPPVGQRGSHEAGAE